MNIFWAVVLALVQGLTEFLPVSSSGHLVIVQNLIPSFTQPGVLFDVILHLGTMCAVLIFFRKKLITLLKKYWLLFIVGSLPAAFIGYFFRDILESLFSDIKFVGFALLITAFFNLSVDKVDSKSKKVTIRNSLAIGVFQALAIIPGVSRSGSTIFAGVFSGIDRKTAAEFSFLLSVPAILGANFLQFTSHGVSEISDPFTYFLGFAIAFISGYISISIVLHALHRKRFKFFGIYCFFLGVSVLLFS